MRRSIARVLAWRPEWPYALLAVLTWIGIIIWHTTSHTFEHAVTVQSSVSAISRGIEVAGWTVMIVAMMLPLTLPAVGHVAFNTIRARRQRAMAIYVGCFIGTWVVLGAAALVARDALVDLRVWNGRLIVVATLCIAAVWQISRFKRRALYQCRQTIPLPPRGVAADAACARFGVLQAWRCVRTCWALMLVMVVIEEGTLLAMTAMTGLVLLEGYTLLGRRLLRLSAGALMVLASLPAFGLSVI